MAKRPPILFPPDISAKNLSGPQDFSDAKLRYPQFADRYIGLALQSSIRDWYEEKYRHLSTVLDHYFLERFRLEPTHLAARWEIYVAALLSEHGMRLVPRSIVAGPDFCIELPGGTKMWVECIVCERGDMDPVEPEPVLVPGKMHLYGGNIEDIHRPRALRLTSAFFSKAGKKYDSYKKSGIVSREDAFVVAISGDKVGHYTRPAMLLQRSFFGRGCDVLSKSGGKMVGPMYKREDWILRANGEKIPAVAMEMTEFSHVSALLYSDDLSLGFDDNQRGAARCDAYVLHHLNPNVAVPREIFRFATNFFKDKSGTIETKVPR